MRVVPARMHLALLGGPKCLRVGRLLLLHAARADVRLCRLYSMENSSAKRYRRQILQIVRNGEQQCKALQSIQAHSSTMHATFCMEKCISKR